MTIVRDRVEAILDLSRSYCIDDIPLGNTEIKQITSTSFFDHLLRLHEVEFNIVSVNGVTPSPTQAGWKNVV